MAYEETPQCVQWTDSVRAKGTQRKREKEREKGKGERRTKLIFFLFFSLSFSLSLLLLLRPQILQRAGAFPRPSTPPAMSSLSAAVSLPSHGLWLILGTRFPLCRHRVASLFPPVPLLQTTATTTTTTRTTTTTTSTPRPVSAFQAHARWQKVASNGTARLLFPCSIPVVFPVTRNARRAALHEKKNASCSASLSLSLSQRLTQNRVPAERTRAPLHRQEAMLTPPSSPLQPRTSTAGAMPPKTSPSSLALRCKFLCCMPTPPPPLGPPPLGPPFLGPPLFSVLALGQQTTPQPRGARAGGRRPRSPGPGGATRPGRTPGPGRATWPGRTAGPGRPRNGGGAPGAGGCSPRGRKRWDGEAPSFQRLLCTPPHRR